MKIRRWTAAAVFCAAIWSASCLVSSLHPAYNEDSIVFDEALIGSWELRENDVSVVVGRGKWRSYDVAYTDRFGTTKFTAHLTDVGGARFLNVRPEDGLERPAYLIASNGILQVAIESSRARVRELDYGVVLERLKAGTLAIDAATDLKQNVLLTAGSSAVRKWLLAAIADDALFAEWKTFTRSAK
jgi:hypothetical protein